VAGYLAGRGHAVLLPRRDRPFFAPAVGAVSFWRPWHWVRFDTVYVRIEGRPVRLPGRFPWAWFRMLKRLFGWTVVWEINAAPDLVAFDGARLDRARRAGLDRKLRRLALAADIAICNTAGLRRFAADLGIARAEHVALGTTPTRFLPSAHAAPRLEVCWITGNSAIGWHDGTTVLRAAELLQSDPGIHFHFVGDFAAGSKLPNVTVHGRVGSERLVELMQQMDVGLAVYGSDHWSRYGVFSSPLKVFDYLAAGLLVVASPIEQIETLIGKGAYALPVAFGDAEALAQILRGVRKDDEFLQRCRDNACLAHEFYHWGRVGARTEEVLQCDSSS
jgi:glycosyltransferase involved in cell wall biosynthesis